VASDLQDALSPVPSPKISEKRLEVNWTQDSLIEAYFQYHHASYPIVHEAIFRDKVARFRNNEVKLNSHWQTLFQMILLTGAFMSSTDHNNIAALGDREIYKAVNLDFFSYGTLEGVQALALMVFILALPHGKQLTPTGCVPPETRQSEYWLQLPRNGDAHGARTWPAPRCE
jgi:hypothetical protein